MLTDGGQSPRDRLIYGFRRATAATPGRGRAAQSSWRGLDRYRKRFAADPALAARMDRPGRYADKPAGLDPLELAAYTATASVILNLDETITRE